MTDQTTHRPHHHTLITSMRDEGPFILEWVAHHLVLGFDRICVATNDCRDGSDILLQAMAAAGAVEHIDNEVELGQIPQHAGYAAMRKQLGINDTEWLMVLDADEFLNVHIGNYRVQDLTEHAGPETDIITLHAMCFADAPEVNWAPGPVCPRFPWRLDQAHKANRAKKSLTRHPERFREIHNHSVVGFRGKATDLRILAGDGVRFNLAEGVPMWKQLRSTPVTEGAHDLAQYNHYAVKTWDSFNLRRERGRGAVALTEAENNRHTANYFAERNIPDAKDLSIARYEVAVAAKMAELLQHPDVRDCQAACEALYAQLAAPYRRRGQGRPPA